MSPPPYEHSRSDDAVSIKLGSDSVKKILGTLLALFTAGGAVKGIYVILEKHNAEIAVLKANDERQEKKLDYIGEHLMGRKWPKQ
jgi:hypothetical protein